MNHLSPTEVDVVTAPPVLENKLKVPTEAKPPVAPAPRPTSLSVRRSSVASHTESPLPSRRSEPLCEPQVDVMVLQQSSLLPPAGSYPP